MALVKILAGLIAEALPYGLHEADQVSVLGQPV
jgi:hypothetical protein